MRILRRLGAVSLLLAACGGEPPPAPRVPAPFDARADLEEIRPRTELLDAFPVEGWSRLRNRFEAKSWTVPDGDRDAYRRDLAAVRARCLQFADPWWGRALRSLEEVRKDPRFAKFLPVDAQAEPPWLVMAQHQKDPERMSTVNVLGNHAKLLRCLHGAFRRLMVEAELPDPTAEELGNPVLRMFVFTDRGNFDLWHRDARPSDLGGLRAYLAYQPLPMLLTYDTGASAAIQAEDTGTAATVGSLYLLHEFRRCLLTQEARRKDPRAPDVPFDDPRVVLGSRWLTIGFGELFGAADRVSSVAGEWRFLRPSVERLREWGDPTRRGDEAQWRLEDLLPPARSADVDEIARRKWPGRAEEMISLFGAESWALSHFLLFAKGGAYRPRYLRMLREAMTSGGSPDLFDRSMDLGVGEARAKALADLERDFHDYVGGLWRSAR